MNPESLPKCNLQELVDAHIKTIHDIIKGGEKSFAPTLIVESLQPLEAGDKPQWDVIVLAGDTYEQRHEILGKLGRKYYGERRVPIGIAFASEAWISKQTHVMPSQADDRAEVLFIAAKSIHGEQLIQSMPITRDKNGNIIESAFITRSDMTSDMLLLDKFYRGFFGKFLEEDKEHPRL